MKEAGLPIRRGNGWTIAAFTALASAACALRALALGQDTNYDQQNYHFYVPYALFNNRILYDIFPAFSGPTFTNPIPYLPFYWLAWNAPPMLIGALLASGSGCSWQAEFGSQSCGPGRETLSFHFSTKSSNRPWRWLNPIEMIPECRIACGKRCYFHFWW